MYVWCMVCLGTWTHSIQYRTSRSLSGNLLGLGKDSQRLSGAGTGLSGSFPVSVVYCMSVQCMVCLGTWTHSVHYRTSSVCLCDVWYVSVHGHIAYTTGPQVYV